MIYEVITRDELYHRLKGYNDVFSYEGARIIYDYITELGDTELDVPDIHGGFTEYSDAEEAAEDILPPDEVEEMRKEFAEFPGLDDECWKALERAGETVLGSASGPVIIAE
jgi:hypothetical protein